MTKPALKKDSHEDFLRLFLSNEAQLRAFVRSCLYSADETDEVMQEVSLVAWRKFETLKDRTRFGAWSCLIARYEILKFRRSCARDRLIFDEDIISKLGMEAEETISLREAQLSSLESCLTKLSKTHQEMVSLAYTSGIIKKKLAIQLGLTEGAFYQKLVRIRMQLRQCMNRELVSDHL